MQSPPVWFEDSQAAPVRALLRWFLSQLNQRGATERVRPLIRKLHAKNFPALFDYSALDEIEFLWEAILELASEPYAVWCDSQKRELRSYEPQSARSLEFNLAAESKVRLWLNCPLISPQEHAWINALEQRLATVEGSEDLFFASAFLRSAGYPGIYPPQALLESLANLKCFLDSGVEKPLTWRQLSARFFFGDSKYLDLSGRQQWLITLFPHLQLLIASRALLLNVHLVSDPVGVLIIENQDSFCWLRGQENNIPCIKQLHLVYGQGFTGSAQRVRDPAYTHFNIGGDNKAREDFEQHWFSFTQESALPYYFWGDLDFAGLSILKALRQQFPSLTAWQPGYQPMLRALRVGVGHLPGQAGKENQLNPAESGCNYADAYLLPALIETGLYLDQEWVSADLLIS